MNWPVTRVSAAMVIRLTSLGTVQMPDISWSRLKSMTPEEAKVKCPELASHAVLPE